VNILRREKKIELRLRLIKLRKLEKIMKKKRRMKMVNQFKLIQLLLKERLHLQWDKL
jgi:hypothetical protein